MTAKKTTLPLEILAIDETGFHLCIEVRINRKKCRMVLDTGASRTVFDQKEIQALVREKSSLLEGKMSAGLGTREMETHSIQLKKFQLGKLSLADFEALVLDLDVLSQSYEQLGHGKVVGVLGSDILHRYQAIIDFGKQKLSLRLDQSA